MADFGQMLTLNSEVPVSNLAVAVNSNHLLQVEAVYCQLRTRRALSLYNVYGDSALLVLNRTSVSKSALQALN